MSNNLLFSRQLYSHLPGSPLLAFSPSIPHPGTDNRRLTRGCTDDGKYSGAWAPENYVVISIQPPSGSACCWGHCWMSTPEG